MTIPEKIRVLLVDDHLLVLDGLAARLACEAHIDIVGQAHNGEEALAAAHELNPDVVIMDVSMPVLSGLEAMARFRVEQPDIRVLMLSMHDDREYILPLVRSGASGYVLKDVSSHELIKAIETVHQGNTYFSSGATQALFHAPEPRAEIEPLSPREESVLNLIALGQSNKEIARTLTISVRTVETHRYNIKQKLNIQTTAGLTRYAIDHNLV
ncbi:response regulator transcription factor [Natronospirillum operosum]|uniref:Response regulator transcription factor n=1 Tax=Natronospirillum operosum TaxID=2759953 RepID=A0A4Z0WAR9_9GAMM|nr:response regulator transcription factor [Natronospirillum operosum]TGG90091.1 response regulator transcription factor [Natronospirillum operosum]